jgi:hypothetical protein
VESVYSTVRTESLYKTDTLRLERVNMHIFNEVCVQGHSIVIQFNEVLVVAQLCNSIFVVVISDQQSLLMMNAKIYVLHFGAYIFTHI